jgi:hypothetical protein
MDTMHIGITGDKTLAVINTIITQRENLNCEFQDSHISYDQSKVINLVALEMYDDASVPKPLTLKKQTDPAPANTTKIWEGVMAVENNLVLVTAYRDR